MLKKSGPGNELFFTILLFYIYYSISSNPQYVLIYCLRLDLKASVYNLYNISHFEYEVNTVVAKILFFINKNRHVGLLLESHT